MGVTSATDPNNHVTRSTWDARGNLLSHTDALTRTTHYAYDALNDVISVTDPATVTTQMTYDANGNLTSDGTRTFEWDPLNRLTAVTSGTHRSEFTYNGLSQRVKIVEKDNGPVTSTRQFVWIPGDIQPAEERDGSNNVTRRYYPQGMQMGSTNYYYTRDHLGSIRELTDNTGAVLTRYDYDPYGRRTKLTGTTDADFGFTGLYYHDPSSLSLAQYRAYSADFGRWIGRDPISETGGLNLYGYLANNPIIFIDPLGLYAASMTGFAVRVGAAAAVGIAIGTASPAVALGALAIGAAILLTPTSIGPEPQSSVAPPGKPPCPPKSQAPAGFPGDENNEHHRFPKEFKEWFNASPRNIDVDDYTVDMPFQWHMGAEIGIHPQGYNAAWRGFIEQNPNASFSETIQFRDALENQMGFGHW